MKLLEIKNLYKDFNLNGRRIRALDDINLTVEEGSFITVLGKSGSGKTTLLRVICGLEEKTGGEIIINHNKRDKIRMGMVFQEPRLMPWLTVKGNMAFSFLGDRDDGQREEIVDKYLNMLGLTNFKDAYPYQISGGMAQRTALGRTLCYDPDIILMDEPLGALDAFNRRKLQNDIIHIYLRDKKTIVFVTHDVDEAVYLGQTTIIMEKGKIIDTIDIDLPYPRDIRSERYFELRDRILNKIIDN